MANLRQYRATRSKPCAICGKGNTWCLVNMPKGGNLCMSEDRPGSIRRVFVDGTIGFYYPPDKNIPLPVNQPQEPEKPMASLSVRHKAYSLLLQYAFYDISQEHLQHLSEVRQIPETKLDGFGTLPDDFDWRRTIAGYIAKEVNLLGVPGFFQMAQNAWTIASPAGILIPYRSPKGQIQGFQVRTDNPDFPRYMWLSSVGKLNGTGATTFMHFQNFLPAKDLWICEGGLKATISAIHTGEAFVGMPGCSISNLDLITKIRRRCGSRLVLCPDADFRETKEVRRQWHYNLEELVKQGFEIKVADWQPEDGKGIDDVLLKTGRLPRHISTRRWRESYPLGKPMGARAA
jgi:hypothetical protein